MQINNKSTKWVLVAAVIALFFVVYIYFFTDNSNSTGSLNPAITSIQYEKPNFIITSKDLSKVEVWGVPEISFGFALLKTTKGENPQEWVLEVPQQPVPVTQIFAKGFGVDGKEVGRAILPLVGTTEIYNALWTPVQEKDFSLGVGETANLEDLSITFKRVTEDSRCPKDVNCVWAGRVVAEIDARVNGTNQTIKISSGEKPYSYNGYSILIKSVEPQKSIEPLTSKDYKITFTLSKIAKL